MLHHLNKKVRFISEFMTNSTYTFFKWCNTKSMTIEESDFRLTSVNDYSNLFNLEILTVINKGKSNERKEFKNVAYGVSLENAIKKIAFYRTSMKLDTCNLKEYIETFKESLDSINSLIKN